MVLCVSRLSLFLVNISSFGNFQKRKAAFLYTDGMQLLRGLGMLKMKLVAFVGWPLMDAVLTVNFLATTAH
ncbi:hypothetical protein AHAS_Ahas19G0126700 [Arachis hypogaea]